MKSLKDLKTSAEFYQWMDSLPHKHKLLKPLSKLTYFSEGMRIRENAWLTAIYNSEILKHFATYHLKLNKKRTVLRLPSAALDSTPAMEKIYNMLKVRGALLVTDTDKSYTWEGKTTYSTSDPVTLESTQGGNIQFLLRILSVLFTENFFGAETFKEVRNGVSLESLVMGLPIMNQPEEIQLFCDQQNRNPNKGENYDTSIRYWMFFYDCTEVIHLLKGKR
jgi:hypothetical protein